MLMSREEAPCQHARSGCEAACLRAGIGSGLQRGQQLLLYVPYIATVLDCGVCSSRSVQQELTQKPAK